MKKKPLSKTAASKSKPQKANATKASATAKQKAKPATAAKLKKTAASPAKKGVEKKSPLKNAVKALGQAGKKIAASLTKPAKKSEKGAEKNKDAKKLANAEKKGKDPKKGKQTQIEIPVNLKSNDAKKDSKKIQTKTTPSAAALKKAAGKKGKPNKKEADDTEDDFVDSDDLLGGDSEIAEYEEELQAVEEMDEEDLDDESELSVSEANDADDEIILTDAEGRRYCRVKDCDQISMVDGYCRYHYLLLWRRIQIRKKILADGKLEKYLEELTSRYPDKFLEMIRKDLKTEKDFLSAISELEIDESVSENEFEEDTQTFIDEVRGLGESASSGVEDEEY